MHSVIPARRRADEFAALVDGEGSSPRHAELLELVTALRDAPGPEARPEFVADLRTRLMTEADTALVASEARLTLPAHTRTRRDRRIAVAAGTIVLVGAGSSMAVASQYAVPGDALYPVKRAIESAQTSMQLDDAARATKMMDIATDRLAEVREVTRGGSTEAYAALPQTFDDFSSQATRASDLVLAEYAETGRPEPVEDLRDFTSRSMDTLAGLESVIPGSARPALEAAALALATIDEQARAACPTCGGGLTEIPAALVAAVSPPAVEPDPVAPDLVIAPAPEVAPEAPAGTPDRRDDEQPRGVLEDPPDLGQDDATPDVDTDTGTSGGSDGSAPSKPLRDLTDIIISTGPKPKQGKDGGGGGGSKDDGVLDPVLDPLLDPVTGEDGPLGD